MDRAGAEAGLAAVAGRGGALGAGRAGRQVARANLARMVSAPCLSRAGTQELETAPCGQVTCLFSQSMANMAAVYPPERACGELSASSGVSKVMPRARAASSSPPLAYPVSTACSPGSRPRASSVSWTGSVISMSVTGAVWSRCW